MATIANLVVNLTANTGSFAKGIKGAGASIGGLTGKLAKFTGAAVVAGAAGLSVLVKGAIDAGDRVQKLSIQTGLSTEFLSEMRSAAELAGSDIETVGKAMKRAQRAAIEASDGNKTYRDTFREIGINVADFLALSPDEQFSALATALNKLEDPARRTAAAIELMGRGGSELLPLLAEGPDGFKRLREAARDAGDSLSRTQADKLAAFNDSIVNLKTALAGLATSIALEVAEPLTKFVNFVATKVRPAFGVVAGAFKTLGIGIGGAGAIIAELFRGNVSGARFIAGELKSDIAGSATQTAESFRQLLEGASNAVQNPIATPEEKATLGETQEQTKLLRDIVINTSTGARVGFAIPAQ